MDPLKEMSPESHWTKETQRLENWPQRLYLFVWYHKLTLLFSDTSKTRSRAFSMKYVISIYLKKLCGQISNIVFISFPGRKR